VQLGDAEFEFVYSPHPPYALFPHGPISGLIFNGLLTSGFPFCRSITKNLQNQEHGNSSLLFFGRFSTPLLLPYEWITCLVFWCTLKFSNSLFQPLTRESAWFQQIHCSPPPRPPPVGALQNLFMQTDSTPHTKRRQDVPPLSLLCFLQSLGSVLQNLTMYSTAFPPVPFFFCFDSGFHKIPFFPLLSRFPLIALCNISYLWGSPPRMTYH